ncbi:MAG: hypothetical protein IAE77_10275 [Prosthecobacter sp.]|uniref:hypothetical protein n=1 Tax=Prosthecobacter sp. TaxID=1965333 RepID=UPI0019DF741B|nr:hypothetical protein [Prosthecobacter sp.]MBE2283830.1 hypothetical protein [Prosthecobacter sp.]
MKSGFVVFILLPTKSGFSDAAYMVHVRPPDDCSRSKQPDPMADPHLPFGGLVEKVDVPLRERLVLLLQGPYPLRLLEGIGWGTSEFMTHFARQIPARQPLVSF